MMNAMTDTDPLSGGWEALVRGAWEDARARFSSVLVQEVTPEALEGLALASGWLDDADVAFEARERAYRLFQERADPRGAARIAIWLAADSIVFRGDDAVANGWLRRASRLLCDLEPSAEHGLLAAQQGQIAIRFGDDPAKARQRAAEAIGIARALGIFDLEMLGLAIEGLALVWQGDVAAGMERLDEVALAAMGGEISDPRAVCLCCCNLIYACEQVRDFDRVAQWCEHTEDFCRRWRVRDFFAICRAHYASVLMWRGSWAEAEAELVEVSDELRATRPGYAADAVARLGELRRRQGRFEEADALFIEAEVPPIAQVGRARLAFDRGDSRTAVELCHRFLRRLPELNRTERASALELLACAHACLGEQTAATASARELGALAEAIDTEPFQASAAFAQGLVAAAVCDHDLARRSFEDAVDLFDGNGLPFEASQARVELAGVLAAQGAFDAAGELGRAASRAFTRLGAGHETTRAAGLLELYEARGAERTVAGLTAREQEVLRLVAEGLRNHEIAARLVLSEHTVHRHVANILGKLELSSRTAAATFAAQHGLL